MLLCKSKAEISVCLNDICYVIQFMGVTLTNCSYEAIHKLHILASYVVVYKR